MAGVKRREWSPMNVKRLTEYFVHDIVVIEMNEGERGKYGLTQGSCGKSRCDDNHRV